MNFEIVWSRPADGNWGVVDGDGNWNGLIGDLVHKRADLAACGLTLTVPRQEAVDFTVGIVEDPLTLISGTPKGVAVNFTAYLSIFTNPAWILVFGTAAMLAIALFAISRMGRYGFHHVTDSEGFHIWNAVSSVLLSMGQLDYPLRRDMKASKLLFVNTCAFAYLMFAYYNAVLTSLMTTAPPPIHIDSFQNVLDNDLESVRLASNSGRG